MRWGFDIEYQVDMLTVLKFRIEINKKKQAMLLYEKVIKGLRNIKRTIKNISSDILSRLIELCLKTGDILYTRNL